MSLLPPEIHREILGEMAGQVDEKCLVVIHEDKRLQLLLAVWHLIPIWPKPRKAPAAIDPEAPIWMKAKLMWDHYEIELTAIKELISPSFPINAVLTKARRLMLVYPDGSIHKHAAGYLRAAAGSVVGDLGVKPAAPGRTKPSGGGAKDGEKPTQSSGAGGQKAVGPAPGKGNHG